MRQIFPGCADQVGSARRLVAFLLAGCQQLEEIVLVADELICNAIRHTKSGERGGTYGLDVRRRGDIVIAVTDQGGTGHNPVPRTLRRSLADLALDGRGLLTVAGLASQWGWSGDHTSRVVWAEFRGKVNGVVPGPRREPRQVPRWESGRDRLTYPVMMSANGHEGR